MAQHQTADLPALLGPLIDGLGYELDEVSVTPVGRRFVVRVVVDGDNGVDLDAIARISRTVAQALDASDDPAGAGSAFGSAAVGGAYTLEVSSPGVDRPLTSVRHWRRAQGRLVTVPIAAGSLTGRVLAVDESMCRLDVEGTVHEYSWPELGPGQVQVEFARQQDRAVRTRKRKA